MSNPTRRSYDAVAAHYAAAIGDELRGKPLDRALLAAVAESAGDDAMLDVGCGPGHVGRYLTAGGTRVYGTDLSPAMCRIARSDNGPACAADMTRLPYRTASFGALVCMYAVIHLDEAARRRAYREFARVLRPGGQVLVAFHTGDESTPTGGARTLDTWWDEPVELTFRFLDADAETELAREAGLRLVARLNREPIPDVEHPSRRCYLILAG